MEPQIRVDVLDNERILLNGIELTDRTEIYNRLRELVRQYPDCSLMVVPKEEKFYVAISKVIYGAIRAGIKTQNLLYMPENGPAVPITQLEPKPLDWGFK